MLAVLQSADRLHVAVIAALVFRAFHLSHPSVNQVRGGLVRYRSPPVTRYSVR